MFPIPAGSASATIYVHIVDSVTGLPKTGLVFNSPGVQAGYVRPRAASANIPVVTLASPSAAWAAGGFVEVDSVKLPGTYRFDLPTAAVAYGEPSVIVQLVFTGAYAKPVICYLTMDVPSFTVLADAGNSPSQVKTDLPLTAVNAYRDGWIHLDTGAMANGAPRRITSSVGVTGGVQLNFDVLAATPADGDRGIVITV